MYDVFVIFWVNAERFNDDLTIYVFSIHPVDLSVISKCLYSFGICVIIHVLFTMDSLQFLNVVIQI